MSYEYNTIQCRLEEGIMLLTINRPEVLNALNQEVFRELQDSFELMKRDPQVKVVVIRGAGDKAFIAGTDIDMMDKMSFLEVRTSCQQTYEQQRSIAEFPKPTIAAINGFAFGGGLEIALCCDIRIASEKAKMGQLETNLGIIPGGGGTQRLSRIVGVGRAKEMIFGAAPISAQRAYEIGLVNLVVPHAQLMEETIKFAQGLAEKSAVALAFAKKAIDLGCNMDLDQGLKTEIEYFSECFATHDGKEGLRAFVEKRQPNFLDQ